ARRQRAAPDGALRDRATARARGRSRARVLARCACASPEIESKTSSDLGLLPPPRAPGLPGSRLIVRKSGKPDLRWGRVGEGGGAVTHDYSLTDGPPPPTPPHKGEGRPPRSGNESRFNPTIIPSPHDPRPRLSRHCRVARVRRGVVRRAAGRRRHYLAGPAHRHLGHGAAGGGRGGRGGERHAVVDPARDPAYARCRLVLPAHPARR